MNKAKAQQLARSLMDKHGLHHVPFEFDRAVKRLGACHFMYPAGNKHAAILKKITLSAKYVELLPEDEVKDVILHEIAHALAGAAAGHGPRWRVQARAIGAKGDRCATPSAAPEASVKGVCLSCGHVYPAHRLPQRVKMCAKCRAPRSQRILEWSKNGRPVSLAAMPSKFQLEMQRAKQRGLI